MQQDQRESNSPQRRHWCEVRGSNSSLITQAAPQHGTAGIESCVTNTSQPDCSSYITMNLNYVPQHTCATLWRGFLAGMDAHNACKLCHHSVRVSLVFLYRNVTFLGISYRPLITTNPNISLWTCVAAIREYWVHLELFHLWLWERAARDRTRDLILLGDP